MVFSIKTLNIRTASIHNNKNSKCVHLMFNRVSKNLIYFLDKKNGSFFIFKGFVKNKSSLFHSAVREIDILLQKKEEGN